MSSEGAGVRVRADPPSPRPVALFGSFRHGQYYEDILAGVVAAADVAGGSVIAVQASAGVLPSGSELDGQEAVSRAAWDHFDGAIVILQTLSLDYVAQLRAAGKFVIAIGQEPRGTEVAIEIDNAGGVREAVTHLAQHGHTAIGFLSPTWQVDTKERYAAYCERMEQLGLTAQPLIGADLPPELSMDQQGYLAAQQFVADPPPCTAVLVGTDLIALGFIRGLREARVMVPTDLAVIGIDDVDEAAVSVPPLATVAVSFERVGEIAFNVALRGGRGEAVEPRYVVSQRLVPRDSCGCINGTGAQPAGSLGSQTDVFRHALAEAARDGALGHSVDVADLDRVARQVEAFLDPSAAQNAAISPPTIETLAAEINLLCARDRSVQAVLRAFRALAEARIEVFRDQDPARAWAMSAATMDLCDAIRSGQLQRRMSEYVDLKRMQVSHYFIGNSLLGRDRVELRSLDWLQETPAETGALGIWSPAGQTDKVTLTGVYEQASTARPPQILAPASPVESFPPSWLLGEAAGGRRLLVITQVMFEGSDWGILAVAGGQALQSALIQETFHQWSILMSVSLDQEQADVDLARQADELTAAHAKEMALLEEVRLSEERYALAAEATHDALWDWDIATEKVFYSTTWKKLLGYRDGQIGTSPKEWLGRVHPEDLFAVQEQLSKGMKGIEQFIAFEHRLRVSSGEHRWIACSGRSVIDDHGQPVRLVGSITDVTARRLLQEQLLQEARFDGLTGLANRALFQGRLNQAFDLSTEDPGFSFAVVFIDLDGFKSVNDTLGHAAGDELLISLARRLQESLRRNDTAARLGGDEFALILSGVDQVVELPLIMERIESLVRTPHQVGVQEVTVGAAIGVALSDGAHSTAEKMLHAADTAMYRAKRRNRQGSGGMLDGAGQLFAD
jgi:diguanylate cyclase (GGDEF)-like protein/PAS domain S-box-containing protein